MEKLEVQGQILTATSGDVYKTVLRRNSDLSIQPAKYIVLPIVYEDIPPVIAAATAQIPPLEIAVKGGGAHPPTWASSDGGVVIDLSNLNKVTLAPDRQSVVVQGGAVWGDVYEVTRKENVDVVGGSLWFIGVGGFTLGGGYGPLSGELGLAIDNLLSAKVVLADGRIVHTSEDVEPELFWAIRGGGGQFGVAVEFTFKVHPPAGPIGSGIIAYPGSELNNVLQVIKVQQVSWPVYSNLPYLRAWKTVQTPAERFTLNFTRPAPLFKPSIIVVPTIFHDTEGKRSATVLAPFRNGFARPVLDKVALAPDMLTVSHSADASFAKTPRRLTIRGTFISDFFPELLVEAWKRWVAFTENEEVRGSAMLWDLTHPGVIAQVPEGATALKTRAPHYWMVVQGRSTTDASVEAIKEFTASMAQFVRMKNAELSGTDLGWFLNMCHGDENPEDVFGKNLPRLGKIKAKYDQKKVWGKGFVIEPLLE